MVVPKGYFFHLFEKSFFWGGVEDAWNLPLTLQATTIERRICGRNCRAQSYTTKSNEKAPPDASFKKKKLNFFTCLLLDTL